MLLTLRKQLHCTEQDDVETNRAMERYDLSNIPGLFVFGRANPLMGCQSRALTATRKLPQQVKNTAIKSSKIVCKGSHPHSNCYYEGTDGCLLLDQRGGTLFHLTKSIPYLIH